jgi:4-aminobutyrate aminotransferase
MDRYRFDITFPAICHFTRLSSKCGISFHAPYLRLIEKLLPVMPHPSLDSFFFSNSGSEAVEAAIKMARAITGRQNVIAMQGIH